MYGQNVYILSQFLIDVSLKILSRLIGMVYIFKLYFHIISIFSFLSKASVCQQECLFFHLFHKYEYLLCKGTLLDFRQTTVNKKVWFPCLLGEADNYKIIKFDQCYGIYSQYICRPINKIQICYFLFGNEVCF